MAPPIGEAEPAILPLIPEGELPLAHDNTLWQAVGSAPIFHRLPLSPAHDPSTKDAPERASVQHACYERVAGDNCGVRNCRVGLSQRPMVLNPDLGLR